MSADFWTMDGYAVFVWGSYAAALIVFAWNLLAPRLRRRDIETQIRRNARDAVEES